MTAVAQALRVEQDGQTVRDAIGVLHPVADSTARIACLVPSISELLCDLGLASQLVARTGFCIHPKELVREIPKVGGTKDVNIEKLRSIRPSHAIVNIDENREALYQELCEFVPTVFVTHPISPQDNVALFRSLGALFARQKEAENLTRLFVEQSDRIAKYSNISKQNVLYLIWKDPWMAVGQNTYIAEMLKLINHQVVAGGNERYPEIELDKFSGRVEQVYLSSEPYAFRDKHVAEVQEIFRDGTKVSLVDGEMLSWYGSRAIQGLAYLEQLATRK